MRNDGAKWIMTGRNETWDIRYGNNELNQPGVVEERYSYVATFDEIKENEFNLNIPCYADTFEEEDEIDIVVQFRIVLLIQKKS